MEPEDGSDVNRVGGEGEREGGQRVIGRMKDELKGRILMMVGLALGMTSTSLVWPN